MSCSYITTWVYQGNRQENLTHPFDTLVDIKAKDTPETLTHPPNNVGVTY
jgi:hypothetical protein